MCGIATASISITDWSKIIAASKAATVRCAGSRAHDPPLNSAGLTTSCATSYVPAPEPINQQVSADYRRFHFLRRTATVLRVLEAA
jgi:hypothetical protein